MKKISFGTLLILLFAGSVLYSCKKDEVDPPVNNPGNAYKGDWEGTFTGDDNGTWSVAISSTGTINGELLSSNAPGTPFAISGTISTTGTFDAYALVMGDTVDFIGQAANDSIAAGTWENSKYSLSGSWAGMKK